MDVRTDGKCGERVGCDQWISGARTRARSGHAKLVQRVSIPMQPRSFLQPHGAACNLSIRQSNLHVDEQADDRSEGQADPPLPSTVAPHSPVLMHTQPISPVSPPRPCSSLSTHCSPCLIQHVARRATRLLIGVRHIGRLRYRPWPRSERLPTSRYDAASQAYINYRLPTSSRCPH